ncbi:MAG: acyloxyacyl hydrolase [Hyphomicrobiaceae bacterium]
MQHASSRPLRLLAGVIAVVLSLGALARPGVAGSLVHELRGGVLYHDVPGLWSGFSIETQAPDINLEVVLSPALPAIWGSIRPAVGVSVNTGGGTSHAYLDARWQVELPHRLFFGLGVGVAVHDGDLVPIAADRKALGSRALFHIPFELGYHLDDRNSVSVYFEHISNANTARFNEGLDRLGIRYGVRF